MRRFCSAGAWPAAAAAIVGLLLTSGAAGAVEAGPLAGVPVAAVGDAGGAAVLRAAGAASEPLPLADYDVRADEAHAVARARGWIFGAQAGNPASICSLAVEDGALVLSAAMVRGLVGAACEFVLFGGERTLASGWGVAGLERTRTDRPSCGYRFLRFPVEDGAALTFQIQIQAARDDQDLSPCTYAIRQIVLRGPAGADWRNAFGP